MRNAAAILVPVLLTAGCMGSKQVRVRPNEDMSGALARRFSRNIARIKVLNYTDRSRATNSFSTRALKEIAGNLQAKGYIVEPVSTFRTSKEQRRTRDGMQSHYFLRNDCALRVYEGYLEVFTDEQLWEGDRPFTDYEEVGRIDYSYGTRMATEKRPNLKGHRNIRRSIEVEAFLFVKGRKRSIYRRSAYVKQRRFDFKKAIGLALQGIPKRKSKGGGSRALSPQFSSLPPRRQSSRLRMSPSWTEPPETSISAR